MSTSNVKGELQKISKACHTSYEKIARDFLKEYKTDFVVKDKQFKNDNDRIRYCLSVMTIRYGDRLPVKPYNIIPIGPGPLRYDKSGKSYKNIYVMVDGVIRRVMVNTPQIIDNIVYDSEYKDVLLSAFTNDVKSDLSADDRAIFKDPSYIDNFDFEALSKVPVVELSELDNNLSKTDKQGWPLNWDWVGVRGFISQKLSGKNKETKNEWGIYRIKAGYGAIEFGSGKVTDSITGWVAPELMHYDIESECVFYGLSAMDDDNNPVLNIYRIKPIFVKEVQES